MNEYRDFCMIDKCENKIEYIGDPFCKEHDELYALNNDGIVITIKEFYEVYNSNE